MKRSAVSVALVFILALAVAGVASAYTSYTPRWTARPAPLGETVDYSLAVAADDVMVYVASVQEETGKPTNSSIDEYYTNGTAVDSNIYYSAAGDDLVFNGITAGLDKLAVAAALSGRWGVAAAALLVYKENLSIAASHVLNATPDLYTAYYGVCASSDGLVYEVGLAVNTSNGARYALVALYNQTLGLQQAVTISLEGAGYNLTAYSCVVGPDGYLYVSGLVLWYYQGVNYPVRLALYKLYPYNLSVARESYVNLYNSQYYVTAAARAPTGIATDGTYLYVAFSYTDEKPDPTSPTAGASVAQLDTSLNLLKRLNLTTDYHEVFDSIVVGRQGDFAVAGYTDNDYGTGLGTSYWHGLTLVFDAAWNPVVAVLAGSTGNNTVWYGVAADAGGALYTAGEAYDDTVYYYNVTTEASTSIQATARGPTPAPQAPAAPAAAGRWAVARLPQAALHEPHAALGQVKAAGGGPAPVKAAPAGAGLPGRQHQPLETPSGASSALLVAYNEAISSPPPPIPEPGLLAALAAGATLAAGALALARRVGRGYQK